MPNQIIGKNDSALQTRIRPSLRVRMCDVQPGNGHGQDLVGWLRDRSPHRFLVGIGEDGGHGSEWKEDAFSVRFRRGYVATSVGDVRPWQTPERSWRSRRRT